MLFQNRLLLSHDSVEDAPPLLGIINEVILTVRNHVSVDWTHPEAARARIRMQVNRVLRRFGYPPDLQDEAVSAVLVQAETLAATWAC